MTDVYKTIVTKRDSRAYSQKPLSQETVRRILQAGRMAGSSKNSQPCRFVVLQDRERKEELAKCGQFAAHIPSAPLIVAITVPGAGQAFDVGRAAQNMMLAAWGEGVTSCPVAMHDEECARQALGLPEGHRAAIVIGFGYAETPESLSRGITRLPLDEFVHHEHW
ncbi:MAG: nitroreductase [Chloroflexi bacterium]|nr:nitroreductase [Chloroflexota bacterium]